MGSTMNIKSIGAVILVASIAGNVYSAEGDVYLGIQYSMVTLSDAGIPDFEPAVLVVRYGKFTSDNISVEGRLGTGLSDDTQDIGGLDVSIDIDHMVGVYGAYYSGTSSSTTRVYGILGITQGELTATIPGFVGSISDDDSDISYGLGVNFEIGENAVINLEYMSYMEIEGTDLTAIAIGYHALYK